MACLEESNPGEPPVRMEDADCPVAGGGDEAAVAAVDARHPSAAAYIIMPGTFMVSPGSIFYPKITVQAGGGGGEWLCADAEQEC